MRRFCRELVPELADAGVTRKSVRQDVALVASAPLTDGPWQPFGEGDLIALAGGCRYAAAGALREPAPLGAAWIGGSR